MVSVLVTDVGTRQLPAELSPADFMEVPEIFKAASEVVKGLVEGKNFGKQCIDLLIRSVTR